MNGLTVVMFYVATTRTFYSNFHLKLKIFEGGNVLKVLGGKIDTGFIDDRTFTKK